MYYIYNDIFIYIYLFIRTLWTVLYLVMLVFWSVSQLLQHCFIHVIKLSHILFLGIKGDIAKNNPVELQYISSASKKIHLIWWIFWDRPGHSYIKSVLDCIPSFKIKPNIGASAKRRPNIKILNISKIIKYQTFILGLFV